VTDEKARKDRVRDTVTEVRVRRAPRLPVFLVLGAVVGAIATFIVTATVGHVDPKFGFAATMLEPMIRAVRSLGK